MHYHKTYDTSDLNVLNVDEYFVITIKKSFCNEVIVIMLLLLFFVEIKGKGKIGVLAYNLVNVGCI